MSNDVGAIHYLGTPSAGAYDGWQLYGLDQLWEMVRDEDGVASFTQVGAWHRMAELCSEQADQLQRALDQLMVHWPARPGSAAELFKLQVTRLISSMRESSAVAAATKQPLTDITMELGRAKDEIGVLIGRKRTYEGQEAALASRPSYPGRGATDVPPSAAEVPPEGWRQQLDQQARRIMAAADAKVGAAATKIEPVRPYQLDGQSFVQPPASPASAGDKTAGMSGGSSIRSNFIHPVAPSFGTDSLDLGEPVLSGGELTIAPPGAMVLPAAAQAGVSSSRSSFVSSHLGKILAPGGTIGGTVRTGPEPARQTTASDSGRRSVGGSMAAVPPARGVTPSRTAQARVVPGGRRRRRSDPADPWGVPQGVPAVLEAPTGGTDHDPGPGVIGLDR